MPGWEGMKVSSTAKDHQPKLVINLKKLFHAKVSIVILSWQ